MEIFNKFRVNFNKNRELEKASESDIERLETELNIKLPIEYKLFISEYGNIYTPEILDKIVDNDIDLNDIQEFWTVKTIINDKQNEWTAKISINIIPIASDCMGNIFAFLAADLNKEKENSPVYFFDHDFDSLKRVAHSFSEWINNYNLI